jgi:hypothetical protein
MIEEKIRIILMLTIAALLVLMPRTNKTYDYGDND